MANEEMTVEQTDENEATIVISSSEGKRESVVRFFPEGSISGDG